MGEEGRNLDPHNISAEAALAQPALVLLGLQAPAHEAVSACGGNSRCSQRCHSFSWH